MIKSGRAILEQLHYPKKKKKKRSNQWGRAISVQKEREVNLQYQNHCKIKIKILSFFE
jgi:hypothetical protein